MGDIEIIDEEIPQNIEPQEKQKLLANSVIEQLQKLNIN